MINNKKVEEFLKSIEPEFNSFGSGYYQLPNAITVYKERTSPLWLLPKLASCTSSSVR